MEEKLVAVKESFHELIEKGQEIREREILNYYDTELPNTNKKEKKAR